MDTSIRDLMLQAETFSTLVADAIIRKTSPVKDDISERQAQAAYGTRWLRQMRELGLAEHHRVGGKVVYSRHQLDCLRAAERQHMQIISKHQ